MLYAVEAQPEPPKRPSSPFLCPSQVRSLTCGARAHFPFLAGMAGNPHHCCSNDAIGRLHHSPKMYNAPLVSTSALLRAGVSSHRSHQCLQMIATRSSSPPKILGALSCMWGARSLSLNPRLGGQPTSLLHNAMLNISHEPLFSQMFLTLSR